MIEQPPPPPPISFQPTAPPAQGVLPPGVAEPVRPPTNEERPKLPAVKIGDDYFLYRYIVVLKSGRSFVDHSHEFLPNTDEESKLRRLPGFFCFFEHIVNTEEVEYMQINLTPVPEKSL